MVLLPIVAIAVGTAAYGWGPLLEIPTGGALSAGTAAQRLLVVIAYVFVSQRSSRRGSRSGCPPRRTRPWARSAARSA